MKKGASSKTSWWKPRIPRPRMPKVVKQIFHYPLMVLGFIFKPLSPFGRYFRGAWRELKLVTWPTRKTSVQLTIAVIIFTLLLSSFIALLDYGFEQLVKRIIL